ncbi:AAA family ATPase [Methylomagnum sp.]
MKANPGGQIDLKEVVGRDEVIEHIWETIAQQSIRMNAERRIGKTTIIKKLQAEPRAGWVPIFQDLEQYHTAQQFAEAVFREVDQFLSQRQLAARRARTFFETISGTQVAGVKLPTFNAQAPWKELLTKAVEDLVEARDSQGERPLFLWDEVPYMLKSIADRDGETVAMEVLDTLRALRQGEGDKGLRMVLTGSIGIHHVLSALKNKSYANSPLNDTFALEVLPLAPDFARDLAAKLIAGEAIPTDQPAALAEAIALVSDGFPFYIHHIAKALKQSRLPGTPESVEQVISRQLLDANDPWQLNHYRERIPTYYGQADEPAVLGILDGVAAGEVGAALSLNELLTELKNTGLLIDREKLLALLRLIEQDHYLARDEAGGYRFKFPLLRRWWRLARGL